MSQHPAPSELRQLLWGGLPGTRHWDVTRHLLSGCPRCAAEIEPYAAFAAGSGPAPPDIDRAYDAAIDSALRRVLESQRPKKAPRGRAARPRSQPMRKPPVHPATVVALLDEAWTMRFESPIRMGHLADHAQKLAARLTARQMGGRRALADLRCRCWLILANALRVRDELSDAHPALKRAFSYFDEGTQDKDLEIQLQEILAALCADDRDFISAEEAAHAAYRIARDAGDLHRAGKALVKAGTYLGWAGRPGQAVQYMEDALRLIDPQRGPELESITLHNMADFLVDCGEFKRAQLLIFRLHGRYGRAGKEIPRLKLRGIQGKIYLEKGDLERAEREFSAESAGLKKAGKPYHAALADLELGVVYLAQVERSVRAGRPSAEHQPILETCQRTVASALAVFKKLHIDREALGAVILLRRSLAAGKLSRADLEKLITILGTADRSPRRKLPDESE